MTYRRRITYAEMATTRNPYPARGADVYSLDELRYYLRKFWADPVYGIVTVYGAKSAFLRACEMDAPYFKKIFIENPPQAEFLSAKTQRRISTKVRNVLTGKIHYETDPLKPHRALGVLDENGTPPGEMEMIPREVRFNLKWSRFGPRIARLPSGR